MMTLYTDRINTDRIKTTALINNKDKTVVNKQRKVSVKGKGKAVPLQAWSGPEGSRKLRFPDFVTTAQDR